jgi:drug/metabolite transporter (DMT)-like permease
VLYFIFSSVLMTINQYAAQALIFRHPDMSIMQMTFARGFAATFVMLAWVNKNFKHVMVSQIDLSCWPSLVFRCAQGALSLFNGFLLLQYFYVSTIQIVCALTPIFTCVLAYFSFGSRITSADIRALIAIFVAIGLILSGGNEEAKTID